MVGALRHALADAGHKASTTVAGAALGAFRPGDGRSFAGRPHMTHSAGNFAYAMQAPYPSEDPQGLAENEPPSLFALAPSAPDATPIQIVEADYQSHPLGVARAQVHETYIVAQTADGIVIVDQHAAHERLVYERMKSALASGGIARQILLIPEVVELDETGATRINARAAELAELGLVVEAFGAGAIVVREVPSLLGETDVQSLIRDLADDLASVDEALTLKDKLGDVCGTLACHSAIRAGRRLNGSEMNALLRQMEVTPHAGQCNHGRPTYVELKLKDIERLFGRR
jgi:DNA mismatch repair protein MutL